MALLDTKKSADRSRNIDNTSKTLLANIRFLSVDNPIRTIVITSAIPNEGKTFVAASLARAMASSGMRTLIVECDMRRRSMAHELSMHGTHGLYSVMSGETPLSEAVVQVAPHLEFLDAEPHIPNPSDLLNTRRFADLVKALRSAYNYVVFDTPPLGSFVDAAVLGSHVDAVFLVVRERYTHHDELGRAVEQLRTANTPLSGVIMNFSERQSSDYYYNYYYYYNESRPRGRRVRSADTSGREDVESAELLRSFDDMPAPREAGGADVEDDQLSVPRMTRSWNNAPDLGDDGARTTTRRR